MKGKLSVAPLTGKSDSFRSCVRASEAVCARERVILHPLGWGNSRSAPALFRLGRYMLTGAGVLRDLSVCCWQMLGF